MAKVGRPSVDINKEEFEKLYLLGVTKQGIAWFFDTSEEVVEQFCKDEYDMTFSELDYAVDYVAHLKHRPTDRQCIIYMHVSPCGKKYVGITSSLLNRRWRDGNGYKQCPRFWCAIKKYGWENIQHAVLEIGLTREEAEEKEREYISLFKTNDKRYGYNLEGGGNYKKIISEETREKLRRNSTGVKPSEETRRKMSETHKGEKCHFYGTHLSDEKKEHLRELKSKGCAQIDDNGELVQTFASMKDAAKAFGRTRQAISACCSGKTKKCAGYYWRWI